MATLTLKKGITRRKKKVLIVNKDLAPAHSMTASSVGHQGTLKSPKKKKKATPPPTPKKVLPVKKPRKPPPSPLILTAKRIERVLTLCEAYPQLFSLENPRPLAIGFSEQLIENNPKELSKKVIRSGVQHYTNLPQYHRAVLTKAPRIDICGADTEAPEPEHIEHAKKRLNWWLTLPERWPLEFNELSKKYPNVFASLRAGIDKAED